MAYPHLSLWTGAASATHASKEDANADRCFHNHRALGVLDGVSGVREEGFDPASMAAELNWRIPLEMEERLSTNAQRYDRECQLQLGTAINANKGGWLRNLCARSFSKSGVLGSTTLAVCHLNGSRLAVATLGDCTIVLYRPSFHGVAELRRSAMVRHGSVPPQAYLSALRNLTPNYVEKIFQGAH